MKIETCRFKNPPLGFLPVEKEKVENRNQKHGFDM